MTTRLALVPVRQCALATGGLAAVVFGASQAATRGRSSAPVFASLLGGLLGIAAFGLRQQRSSDRSECS